MFKSIQLLNEDCHTNVVFQYHNVTSYGSIQIKCYKHLLQRLGIQDKVIFNLSNDTLWQYTIGLAMACKFYNIKMQYFIPENQKIDIFKLYVIYILNLSQAEHCKQLNSNENIVEHIDQEKMDLAIQDQIQELYQDISEYEYYNDIHFKAKLFPAELTIFTYQDFYKQCQKMNNSFRFVIEVPDTHFRDYFSWIQNVEEEAKVFNFFYTLNTNKNYLIDECECQQYLDKYDIKCALIKEQFQNLNLDKVFDYIFEEEQQIFKQPQIIQNINEFIWVDHNEVLKSFGNFLSVTHTLAAGMFLTPFTYVESTRHAFTPQDYVLVEICGSLLTNKQFNAHLIYTRNYLLKCLQLKGDIATVKINYNNTRISLTTFLFDQCSKYNLSVYQALMRPNQIQITLFSPGEEKLLNFIMSLRQSQQYDSVECENLNETNKIQPDLKNYEGIHTNFQFDPLLKDIQQLNTQNIRECKKQLIDQHLIDHVVTLECKQLNEITNANVILCMENLQQSGSFKIRGASNLLINIKKQLQNQQVNIIACSAGNHAQGISLAAQRLNMNATIVMPNTAPVTKQYNVKRYGAELVLHGEVFDQAAQKAQELVKQRKGIFASPYNDLYVIQGQATIASELLDKYTNISEIYVPTGGSGLLSGITLYAKQIAQKQNKNIKCVGIQAQNVFPLKTVKEDHQYDNSINPQAVTLADGCNVKHPGGIQDSILYNLVDDFVGVSENQIAAGVIEFLMYTKTLAEGAGVLAFSALLNKLIKPKQNAQVACIISGGNIDISEISMGQRVVFQVKVPDKPGELQKISQLIQSYTGVLDTIRHIRGQQLQWDQTIINCEVQTCSRKAGEELKNKIMQIYGDNAIILNQ